MTRLRLLTTAIALSLTASVVMVRAQQVRSGAAALRAAIEAETIRGDVRTALEQYQQVAEIYAASDRAVAAQALLRIGQLQEKLGNPQAAESYKRVVNNYADQRDPAATAQDRLAAPVARQLRNSGVLCCDAHPFSDGRYIAFTDGTGNVAVRDLTTDLDRQLTTTADWSAEYAAMPVPSSDGAYVAYVWYLVPQRKAEIRLISSSSARREPQVVLQTEITEIPYKIAWMPDDRQLQVVRRLSDRTSQIGVVTLGKPSFRTIKSLEWRAPNLVSVSPDGRYLAYDVPVGDTGAPRDIMVLAIDGSRETTVAANPANDAFPVWSPDGRQLLFLSDRSGRNSLWAVPIEGGRPGGQPTLIRNDVGPISVLGLTKAGALYYSLPASIRSNVFMAELDGLRTLSAPVLVSERPINRNLGSAWSPDGESLAYFSLPDTGSPVLVVRSARTGVERSVRMPDRLSSRFGAGPKWFPDNRSVLVEAADAQGAGFSLYKVSLATGNTELLARLQGEVYSYDLSADGRTIFYAIGSAQESEQKVIRLDVQTRVATELRTISFPDTREIMALAVSPDRTRLAMTLQGGVVQIMPAEGGQTHVLWTPEKPEGGGQLRQALSWTRDGRFLLFARGDGLLWKAPVAGGPAEKVLDYEYVQSPSLHPDGKRLLFTSVGSPGAFSNARNSRSVWVIDRVLGSR